MAAQENPEIKKSRITATLLFHNEVNQSPSKSFVSNDFQWWFWALMFQ
jgi:hypothetical protein